MFRECIKNFQANYWHQNLQQVRCLKRTFDKVIPLPYLNKLSVQIHIRINRIMKNKLPYYNIRFIFQTKCKISHFFTFKDKMSSFLLSDIVYIFECGTAMLPIIAKLNVILMSECVNTWEFLHSLGKELKVMMIPPLKNIFYSAITHLNLKISQFLQATTMTLKSR